MGDEKRTVQVVGAGWFLAFAMYTIQMGILLSLVVEHHDSGAWAAVLISYLLVLVPLGIFLRRNWELKYAEEDKEIWLVWLTWGTYIVAYVVTVGMIFFKVADDLDKDDLIGINALKATLCITPGLLILFLQLTICPSYRKPVLHFSVFAALDIFDGIEMLEIVLMKNEGHFHLHVAVEKLIVASACVCFLLSSLALVRYKFGSDGEVTEDENIAKYLGPMELIGTNLPFLILRAIVSGVSKYEASVFIAKNVISLIIGAAEFCIFKKYFKWGDS